MIKDYEKIRQFEIIRKCNFPCWMFCRFIDTSNMPYYLYVTLSNCSKIFFYIHVQICYYALCTFHMHCLYCMYLKCDMTKHVLVFHTTSIQFHHFLCSTFHGVNKLKFAIFFVENQTQNSPKITNDKGKNQTKACHYRSYVTYTDVSKLQCTCKSRVPRDITQ